MLQKKEFKSKKRAESASSSKATAGLPSPMTARQRLRRQSLLFGLPGPVTRRRPFHSASLWWEVPGPTMAQCLPGPTVLNTIDHAVVIGANEVTGRRDAMTHQGPATRPDVGGVGSGPGPRLQEGPALEPGTLTQRMLRDLVVFRGGRRRSGHQVCIAVSRPHVGALGQREGPPVCVPAIEGGPWSSSPWARRANFRN